MNIHFILCHPAVQENIGFTCRAMKTMGFSKLRLINPASHFDQKVLKTAYGSHDVLESAVVFEDLQGAIKDMDLVIGTTAKNRVGRHDYYEPAQLERLIASKKEMLNNIGLVFGSEKNGLNNEEIAQCHILSTVSLATQHPSLNLAQAVMIYAYELSEFSFGTPKNSEKDQSDTDQVKLRTEATDLLRYLEVDSHPSLYQRIKDRLMSASAADTSLLLSLSRFIKRRFDK